MYSRGKNDTEMGDNLVVVSIPFTGNPTTNPTTVPTADPTVDPTADPTPEPTTDPTRIPTTVPTHFPTVSPSAVPTVEPSMNPTTTCSISWNCTECLNMNSVTKCLWRPLNDRCYSVSAVATDETVSIAELQTSCSSAEFSAQVDIERS